jgi:hypothetical protein
MKAYIKNQKVISVLKKLYKQNDGILTAETVIEAAKPSDSPLHSWFTWDDTEAAHQWRLHQARMMLRVVVQMLPSKHGEETNRIFVSLSPDRQLGGGGYKTMVDVLSDDEMRNQLLEDAIEDMKRFRQKYQQLKELSDVFEAMNAVETKKSKAE